MTWFVTANESWGVSKMKLHRDANCHHLDRHRQARDSEIEACRPCKTCTVWIVSNQHRSSGDRVYHTDPECSFLPEDKRMAKAKADVDGWFDECEYCAGDKPSPGSADGGHLASIRDHVLEESGEDIFKDRSGFYAGENDA